ncbi:CAP domain-containing protein [Methylosinus sp. Sm6]|uniref:CAP domain-containing protein n=1 Tax=Methylosinus sp. Sm6 TaxID=2866948 RepID=UPI001C993993|nr:CAP domain-containing protein [Methylosinus sp. Sm6]MBY6241601.1 CAP domain-containing protein [Methylosinus sp. Sm6]
MPLTLRFLALAALLPLCACGDRESVAPEPGEPSFYRSLAAPGARVDARAAREMISLYRRNNGLSALALDDTLQEAAQSQADAMAGANSLDHNVRGTLDKRLTARGLKSASAAENVSAGYHTLAEAFSGWRQSPPHNRNLLMKGATRMGIATAYAPGTRYRVYWALILAD